MQVPRYRDLVEIDPDAAFPASRIFENRVLYPWLVSLLLPVMGFHALFAISAIAYVAFGAALFWLLLAFGRPWIAVLLCVAALALPLTRQFAASDLTDMLAVLWWTLCLSALLRLMQRRSISLLFVLAVASILLTLTRPAPYLPIVPALAVTAFSGSWMVLIASCSGAAVFAALAFGTRAFNAGDELRWVYTHESQSTTLSFGAWYRTALEATARYTFVQALRTVVPALLLAAALYGATRTRLRAEMTVLLAAAVACVIAIPFNPVPSAIGRVVVFPLVPVFCAIVQCVVAAVATEHPRTAAERARAVHV
jgi:hypothetical protein